MLRLGGPGPFWVVGFDGLVDGFSGLVRILRNIALPGSSLGSAGDVVVLQLGGDFLKQCPVKQGRAEPDGEVILVHDHVYKSQKFWARGETVLWGHGVF